MSADIIIDYSIKICTVTVILMLVVWVHMIIKLFWNFSDFKKSEVRKNKLKKKYDNGKN